MQLVQLLAMTTAVTAWLNTEAMATGQFRHTLVKQINRLCAYRNTSLHDAKIIVAISAEAAWANHVPLDRVVGAIMSAWRQNDVAPLRPYDSHVRNGEHLSVILETLHHDYADVLSDYDDAHLAYARLGVQAERGDPGQIHCRR
jgi:hypothetical protein